MSVSRLNQRLDQQRDNLPIHLELPSSVLVSSSKKDDEITFAQLGLAALLLPSPVFAATAAASNFGALSQWTDKINPSKIHAQRSQPNISTAQSLGEASLWDGLCEHIGEGYKSYKKSLDGTARKQLEELENSFKRIADVFVAAGEALYAAATSIIDPIVKSVMIAADSAKPVVGTSIAKNAVSGNMEMALETNVASTYVPQANLNVSSQASSFELNPNLNAGQIPAASVSQTDGKLQEEQTVHAVAQAINNGALQVKNLAGASAGAGSNAAVFNQYSTGEEALVNGALSYEIVAHDVLPANGNLISGAVDFLPTWVGSNKGQSVADYDQQSQTSKTNLAVDSPAVINQSAANDGLNEKIVKAEYRASDSEALSLVSERIEILLADNKNTKGLGTLSGISEAAYVSFNKMIDQALIGNVLRVAEQSVPRYTNDLNVFLSLHRDAVAETRSQKEVSGKLAAIITEVHSKGGSNPGDSQGRGRDDKHLEEYASVNETSKPAVAKAPDTDLSPGDVYIRNADVVIV